MDEWQFAYFIFNENICDSKCNINIIIYAIDAIKGREMGYSEMTYNLRVLSGTSSGTPTV